MVTGSWSYDDHPLRVMIVGDKSYAEAKGLDGWYRRCKSDAWGQEVEELWEVEEGVQEYRESFGRMANGVIKAMQADEAFPADGEAAWNELLFEAAVHSSAINDGKRVLIADVEKAQQEKRTAIAEGNKEVTTAQYLAEKTKTKAVADSWLDYRAILVEKGMPRLMVVVNESVDGRPGTATTAQTLTRNRAAKL